MPNSTTQSARRVKYGLNVAVAALAALALAVCFNWLVQWQVERVTPSTRHWLRYDLTATRQYSLSKQTIKLLDSFNEPVNLVTLFAAGGPNVEKARDLLDEYARYGKNIKVQHINPTGSVTQLEGFYGTLAERYAAQIEPVAKAIDDARKAIADLRAEAPQLAAPVRNALADEKLTDAKLKQLVQSVASGLGRLDEDLVTLDQQLDKALKDTLPDYAGARASLQSLLTDFDGRFFSIAIEQFDRAVKDAKTPPSVKDNLLQAIDRYKATRERLKVAATALQASPASDEYDKVRNQIMSNPNTIVVMGARRVQVLWLEDMFRAPPRNPMVQNEQQPELLFMGEEKITGAPVSLQLTQPPMVVFVAGGQFTAMGPRGQFNVVAQRLRNMNFRVEEWNPAGQAGPMGQPMPPGPPPEPEAGQKVVWVLLPQDPPNPMNPMAGMGGQQAVEHVRKRIDAGDAAMVMLAFSPAAMFGGADPAVQIIEPWGITPQLDRVILQQITIGGQKPRAMNVLRVDDWSGALPVTQALSGMSAVFPFASPLILAEKPPEGVKTTALVTVRAANLWAERNVQEFPNLKLDVNTAAESFIIVAAAESGDRRLIVVSDGSWATDQVTDNADEYLRAPGLGQMFGVAYPGNAELFANSMYWLTGMDQLIAASARSQDIRRVGRVSDAGMTGLRWALIAGMPLAILAVGIGVWTVRRRV